MESNLTLPILCAYLPYKVKMYHPKTAEYIKSKGLTYHPTFLRGITSEVLIWVGTDNNSKHITEDGYKLLLRPLSDLTDEHKKELSQLGTMPRGNEVKWMYYMQAEFLLKHHYDIWNGIEAGWALNLNDHEN